MANKNNFYFIKEVAQMLNKTEQFINLEIKRGNLKAYKRAGHNIIYKKDLLRYIGGRKQYENLDLDSYQIQEEEIIIPEKEREEPYGDK